MIRGIYNGAAALNVIAQQQELISSNLANLNTGGHRRAQLAHKERENPTNVYGGLQHSAASNATTRMDLLGPGATTRKFDFTNGRLHHTGRPLDVSLVGDGFFVLENSTGDVYTRSGNFYRNPETDSLVNGDGIPVKGENGPINIPKDVGDSEIYIANDGTISAGEQTLGKLAIVSFANNDDLLPVSQSGFQAGPNIETVPSEAKTQQYYQELSNSSPVTELIALIAGTRQYEAVQKISTAISEALREHIRA